MTYLTFGSTHGALKAEATLTSAGIRAQVVPKPTAIRGACGLAVRVRDADAPRALDVLARAQWPPRQAVTLASGRGDG